VVYFGGTTRTKPELALMSVRLYRLWRSSLPSLERVRGASTIVHEMEGDDLRPWRLGRRDRGETEAGPSMALEESVVGNPRCA
jgi:hypothetical protein